MMLGVVIPHHSQRDALDRALASVEGQSVVVVDDSEDGGLVLPGVEVLRTTGGEGFGRAVNRGLSHLEAKGCTLALLLNDDAVLDVGALEALMEAWCDEDGALGPVIHEAGGPVYGIRVSPMGRVRLARTPGPVQALSGAAMIIRTGERFDERFRHGFEDLELCRRLHQRGLRVRVVGSARCHHIGGATVGRDTREATRGSVGGHLQYLGGGPSLGIALALAMAQVCVEGPRRSRFLGLVEGIGDFVRARRRSG